MVVEQIQKAAIHLLESLRPAQRSLIQAPFDTPDHQEWTYLPGHRPGLPLSALTPEQQQLAHQLIAASCSERGLADSLAVLDAEVILRGHPVPASTDWQDSLATPGYFLRILGDPASFEPWAWRLNGHHLAIHVTLVDGAISFTPSFIGSNPAEAPSGRRFLAAEHDLGFQLLQALDDSQRAVAVVSSDAPDDMLTRHDPVADPALLHRGLAYGDMTAEQRQLLSLLVGQYVSRAAGPIGLLTWQDLTEQGIENLTFAWAGETTPGIGHRHYYSLAAPTFLAEYDNTQDNANHIHSVWRSHRSDWGTDLLAAHYAEHR
ncbi:DUF3500 domain-containing protein [Kribbella sp. NBC_01505]|uniref:DUF3500 domain-containing protein n=1 Tax=Kribbella sp. NBC_01505 TaxID=2903580 RepID=UPI003864F5ED